MESKKINTFQKISTMPAKKISRLVVLIFFVITLIISSLWNLTFTSFDTKSWIAKQLMMLFICVFGLLFGESSGTDYYKELTTGIYLFNLNEYNATNERTKTKFQFFDAWFLEQLPPALENKKIDFLVQVGVPLDKAKKIVKYCELSDLYSLTHEKATKITTEKNGDIYIKQLQENQVEAVKYVLEGNIKLDNPNSSYYLTAFSDGRASATIYEVGRELEKAKHKTRTISRILKITSSLVVSTFFAIITINDFMGQGGAQAWMDLLSRFTSLITSLISGFASARVSVNLESRQIKNKTLILGMFEQDLNNGKINQVDNAKQIWEEEQKKKEEAMKNIITPEPEETELIEKQEPQKNIGTELVIR